MMMMRRRRFDTLGTVSFFFKGSNSWTSETPTLKDIFFRKQLATSGLNKQYNGNVIHESCICRGWEWRDPYSCFFKWMHIHLFVFFTYTYIMFSQGQVMTGQPFNLYFIYFWKNIHWRDRWTSHKQDSRIFPAPLPQLHSVAIKPEGEIRCAGCWREMAEQLLKNVSWANWQIAL